MIELAPDVHLLAGDCLELLPTISGQSVDMVLTDLPYGTTYAPWDSDISLEELWTEWRRILKPGGAVVMTASQPFTTTCVASNIKEFRCEWIWDKQYPTNFANAKRHPLKTHESVLVFGPEATLYRPQMTRGAPNHSQGQSQRHTSELMLIDRRAGDDLSGQKYPNSILRFPRHSSACRWHSTEKPVELFEYLIRTYSQEGDLVLDNCAGGGTTGIAAYRARRRALLMERDPAAQESIRERFSLPAELGVPMGDQELERATEKLGRVPSRAREQAGNADLFDLVMSHEDQ